MDSVTQHDIFEGKGVIHKRRNFLMRIYLGIILFRVKNKDILQESS